MAAIQDSSPAGTQAAGAVPYRYWSIAGGHATAVDGGVIEETTVTIFVNGQELATLMCSPLDQDALALGFLFNEGVIASREDVRLVRVNTSRASVDVFLHREQVQPPRRMILTSGCGGGVTFQDAVASLPALESAFSTTPQALLDRMRDLYQAASLFAQVRGVHTSILAAPDRLLLSAEDIGRHNTLDKLAGKALQQAIPTRDRILLTSGRVSTEMVTKARHMGVPLIASRTSPTSASLALAQGWNICVVGYLRGPHLRVYTRPERLGLPAL